MNKLLYISAITALLTTACESFNPPSHPPGSALRYHNAKSGFTFFMPASWRGYSVLHEQWEAQTYLPANDTTLIVAHGPVIVLRHPHWTVSEPYQDITFLVYTRSQWDAEKQGKFCSTYFAGGTMVEMWHNRKYVFAMSTHESKSELNGWREVSEIVSHNLHAYEPPLYPE
jgi:hypothetical protein